MHAFRCLHETEIANYYNIISHSSCILSIGNQDVGQSLPDLLIYQIFFFHFADFFFLSFREMLLSVMDSDVDVV